MSTAEAFWHKAAARYRQTVAYWGTSRRWLDESAERCEINALACALRGVDLSLDALFAPTPGDALALTEVA